MALLLAAALPGQAQAKRTCQAPPGRSGIDQYCETVPGSGGDESSGRFTRPGRHRGAALPGNARSQLRRAGASGAGVLNLVDQSRSNPPRKREKGSSSRGTRSGGSAPESVSSNPLTAVRSGVESGSSAGAGFIWALIGIAVLLLAFGWLRYRRRAG